MQSSVTIQKRSQADLTRGQEPVTANGSGRSLNDR